MTTLLQAPASAAATPRIFGQSFPEGQFRFVERNEFDPALVAEVIEGRLAGVIFRRMIPADDCLQIARNFWAHDNRYERKGPPPAAYLGTYHYGKDLDKYLDEAAYFNPTLSQVFDGATDWYNGFLSSTAQELAKTGSTLRLARHLEREAGHFVMRSWEDAGAYALQPHDDAAQCQAPNQAGFEIQAAASNSLVAVNMCLENGRRGHLHYWNIMPDDESRDRLGLTYTGYPYPLEAFDSVTKIVLPIRPGDVYCFNGKAVHAVEAIGEVGVSRASIAFLLARLDPRTVIHWT